MSVTVLPVESTKCCVFHNSLADTHLETYLTYMHQYLCIERIKWTQPLRKNITLMGGSNSVLELNSYSVNQSMGRHFREAKEITAVKIDWSMACRRRSLSNTTENAQLCTAIIYMIRKEKKSIFIFRNFLWFTNTRLKTLCLFPLSSRFL